MHEGSDAPRIPQAAADSFSGLAIESVENVELTEASLGETFRGYWSPRGPLPRRLIAPRSIAEGLITGIALHCLFSTGAMASVIGDHRTAYTLMSFPQEDIVTFSKPCQPII